MNFSNQCVNSVQEIHGSIKVGLEKVMVLTQHCEIGEQCFIANPDHEN